MTDNEELDNGRDSQIRQYFNDTKPDLPTNFSWLVARKVYELKIIRARKKALWESTLISVPAVLLGVALLAGYLAFTGNAGWELPFSSGIATPAILTLVSYLVLDNAFGAFRDKGKQS